MKKKERILASDPGTRHIGFAILERGQLFHYGVKSIRRSISPGKKLKEGLGIVLSLSLDLRPGWFVVEKTFFANNRNSALLNVFADELLLLGRWKRLKTRSLAANTVRKAVCGKGDASKDDLAHVLISTYPELRPYLSSNRRWKERFHRNMFDAVGLAVAATRLYQ